VTSTGPEQRAQEPPVPPPPDSDGPEEGYEPKAQVWPVAVLALILVGVALVLFEMNGDVLPDLGMDAAPVAVGAAVLSVVVLPTLAMLIYIVRKERKMRRVSSALIEERVLSAALSNRLTEISALSEVGKAVNTTLDLDDVLALIISSANDLLGGTEGSIMLLDDDKRELRVVSYQGPHVEVVMKGRATVGQGISGRVAQDRKPMLLQGDDRPARAGDGERRRKIHSAMCVPLIRQDEVIGVLNLSETVGRKQFTEHDLAALGLFAEHAAIAIGNAKMYEAERRTVARLEELDRMKSDFVATVSHELKTPLTAIIGAAKTLSRRGPSMQADQQALFMEMIERQGNRLLRLVDDVLTAARMETGQQTMKREHLDLRSIAEAVRDELSLIEVGKERPIDIVCDPERPTVWGDRTGVQQMMVNLVENALKYSPADKPVQLTLVELPSESVLEVTDQGQGMTDEQLADIFERFRQLDQSSTRPVGGFGLGLYIVKNLVNGHQGEIEVESEEGKGTTFRIRLPKRADDS
jgi:two-component system, OmpR family, sensor histidine kinase KdpD